MFDGFIGIDYSGRGTPLTRTAGLQVYAATNRLPTRLSPPSTPKGRNRNWCRKEVSARLIQQATSDKPFIAGLDFSFSLPLSYFRRYRLSSWDAFLADFVKHWPTDQVDATVEALRNVNARTGTPDELRTTERRTPGEWLGGSKHSPNPFVVPRFIGATQRNTARDRMNAVTTSCS